MPKSLQDLVDRANRSSKRAGLSLNAKKPKVLKILSGGDNDDEKIFVNGEALENAKEFTHLGVSINSSYNDSPEVKKRIAITKSTTTALTTIWKDRSISKKTKIRLLNALVFPIASYGCETWVLKKSDKRRLQSFEIWCYRRVLRISWTERITNEQVLQTVQCKRRFLSSLVQRRLSYLGHVLRSNTLEKEVFLGCVWNNEKRTTKNSVCRQCKRRVWTFLGSGIPRSTGSC